LGIRDIDDGPGKSFQIKVSLGGIGIVTVEAVVFEKRFNAFGDSYLWLCIGLKPANKGNHGCNKECKPVGSKNHRELITKGRLMKSILKYMIYNTLNLRYRDSFSI
jgi:hypothetical protein